MSDNDTAGQSVATPAQSELGKTLADANFEASKVLEDHAVSQGAYVEGRKSSEQNKESEAAEKYALLRKEADEAADQRNKEKEQLRKDREKAAKDAAKS